MQEIIDKEIDEMLRMGVIEHLESPYVSSLVLVKKPDETYRVCVNFKELNKIAVFDPEPMMSPDDIFPKLSSSQIYSTFDFSKGYWAIPMEEKLKDITTFITSRGLMRFRVMPFGMVNSGSTYNRMVRKLSDGAQSLENYVDDVRRLRFSFPAPQIQFFSDVVRLINCYIIMSSDIQLTG